MEIKYHNKGFTLIELLLVISIIGFLTAVVLASVNSARDKAFEVTKTQSIRQYMTALESYYTDKGGYPQTALVGPVCLGFTSSQSCLGNFNGFSYGGDNDLNLRLKPYINGTSVGLAQPLIAKSTPGGNHDWKGVIYFDGNSNADCTNQLCQSYVMYWYLPGIRQNCSPGFRVRCGDINEVNFSTGYPYGVTECQLNIPTQNGDTDVPWC
jgi:prepilin-type N-terminal cleavage/methylation domain-containing protein